MFAWSRTGGRDEHHRGPPGLLPAGQTRPARRAQEQFVFPGDARHRRPRWRPVILVAGEAFTWLRRQSFSRYWFVCVWDPDVRLRIWHARRFEPAGLFFLAPAIGAGPITAPAAPSAGSVPCPRSARRPPRRPISRPGFRSEITGTTTLKPARHRAMARRTTNRPGGAVIHVTRTTHRQAPHWTGRSGARGKL